MERIKDEVPLRDAYCPDDTCLALEKLALERSGANKYTNLKRIHYYELNSTKSFRQCSMQSGTLSIVFH